MKYIALLLLLVPFAASASSPVSRFADEILRRQASDGAIVTGPLIADSRLVPYFAHQSALGLVSAYGETKDKRYLDAARRWAAWYAAHMNASGTVFDYSGRPGHWVSKNDYDSTDSYAALYLELLEAIARWDRAWAVKKYATVGKAIRAIKLTTQPNGLTLAKPKWPVMYTMDNVETARGLRAAAHLATLSKRSADAKVYTAMAARMEVAIERDLWDAGKDAYLVGLQPDGGRMVGAGEWYPDVMASLMAIGWGPKSERHAGLYARFLAAHPDTIPASVKSEDDLDHLLWWGFAARARGDATRFREIASYIAATDLKAVSVPNTAVLGQACRLLAARRPSN